MSSSDRNHHEDITNTPITRREVLKRSAVVGGGMAFGPALAACGGGNSSSMSPSTSVSSGGPKKGGHLRVGVTGGSNKETLDAQAVRADAEVARSLLLYNALLGFDHNFRQINLLAESVEVNKTADVWTVKLLPNAEFHNGKPVTADDVVFSFRRILDPKNPKDGATTLGALTASGVTKVDSSTVQFKLEKPNAIFRDGLAYYSNAIIPVGYDLNKAIGTGPFKLTSFLPGQQATFAPNANYFGQVPYVDQMTIIEFVDVTARVNALLGGTVDAISHMPSSQANVITGAGKKVLVSHQGAWKPFTMRIDQKPFTDVRVRQAFKLIVDRKAMIEQALSGYGLVGNDMYGLFDPGYPKDLPQREQDLEQAKALLKSAGYDNDLTVVLNTSDAVGIGGVSAAQVFAEQAKGAGVTVDVNKVDSSVFYGVHYLKWTFAQDFWYTRNYLLQASVAYLPTANTNEPHWQNDKWLAIVEEAIRTVDDTKRNELVGEAATIEYNEQGLIVWSFQDQVDAYSEKLGGVVPDKFAPLSGYQFNEYYFV